MIELALSKQINDENVLQFLQLSEFYSLNKLRDMCGMFLLAHWNLVRSVCFVFVALHELVHRSLKEAEFLKVSQKLREQLRVCMLNVLYSPLADCVACLAGGLRAAAAIRRARAKGRLGCCSQQAHFWLSSLI